MASGQEQRGMTFAGLAPGVIPQQSHVARLALALEGSNLIDAHLGANSGGLALIDVHTGALIVGQFVAIVADAAVAHGQIFALVHAIAIIRGALIDATLASGLVLAIRTILPPVTDLREGNALASPAIKFTGRIAIPWRPIDMAVLLITAIRTVEQSIAGQLASDAAAIVALELIWTTGYAGAILRRLVLAVGTICLAIANPRSVQAGNHIRTLELGCLAYGGAGCAVLLKGG